MLSSQFAVKEYKIYLVFVIYFQKPLEKSRTVINLGNSLPISLLPFDKLLAKNITGSFSTHHLILLSTKLCVRLRELNILSMLHHATIHEAESISFSTVQLRKARQLSDFFLKTEKKSREVLYEIAAILKKA